MNSGVRLFHRENLGQEIRGSLIFDLARQGDGVVVGGHSSHLSLFVARDDINDRAADMDRVEIGNRRCALQEENAADQPLSVVHFINGLSLDGLVQLPVSPIIAHLGMHHVLVDGGQLVREELVEYD